MESKKNDAIENARLCEVDSKTDASGMNRWVEELLERYSDTICCRRFQSVFRCMDIENQNVLIGAAGRLIGMRIFVSHSMIKGELDIQNKTFSTILETPKEGFQSIPFQRVFSLCNRLRDEIKDLLKPEFYRVPFLGGMTSIILSEQPQEIINYYLPEVELFGKDGKFSMFSAGYLPEQIPLPRQTQNESDALCLINSKEQCPAKEEYMARMAGVMEKLKNDFVQKVVVARKCIVTAVGPLDKLGYAAHLIDRYFQEYFYMFRQGGEEYWIGISPEIIMKQHGSIAVTKPLAGTRRKFDDAAVNEKVRTELTSTSKDIIEHDHALHFMVSQLENANIGEVHIDKDKTVLETPYAFHIKSEISIRIKKDISCFDIIGAIYPPATIWGIPVDRTEYILAQTEPFDREYFTGIYGYWNYEGDADTALIIRSAKVEGNRASIYAGGGIVKYSDLNDEFEETVNKMRPLLSYFVEDQTAFHMI